MKTFSVNVWTNETTSECREIFVFPCIGQERVQLSYTTVLLLCSVKKRTVSPHCLSTQMNNWNKLVLFPVDGYLPCTTLQRAPVTVTV